MAFHSPYQHQPQVPSISNLVAGLGEEPGRGEVIDHVGPQNPEMSIMTVGYSIKGMAPHRVWLCDLTGTG